MKNERHEYAKPVYEAPKCEMVSFAKNEKAATVSGIDGFDIKSSWLRSGS